MRRSEMPMVNRILKMKVGQHFIVGNEKERQSVCRIAKILRASGGIEFEVITRADDGGKFKVSAI